VNWIPGRPRSTKTSSADEASPRAVAARVKALREQVARLRASLAAGEDSERDARERELGQAIAEGGGEPLEGDSAPVIAAAACHAEDKALALEWLARLSDEAALAKVALEARYAELRFAAAQRLTSDAILERVAAGARERDKRVHRHCADLLRGRKEHSENAQRAEELGAQLEALAAEPAPLPVARLTQVERALQALGDCAEGEPCREKLEQLFVRMRAESEALRELHRIAARVDVLGAETAAELWPVADRLGGWRADLASLRESAAALPAWTASIATSQAMQQALAAIEARLAAHAEDVERYEACERLLDSLEGAGDPAAWEALAKPHNSLARHALEAKWTAREERLRPPPAPTEPPKPKSALDLAAVQKALFALDQAIEQGHVADAERFDARIEKLIGAASLPKSLDARWKRARGEITRLRGWARWGSTQAHDLLIAEAEQQLAAPLEVEALAQAIARFREEWKRIDATGAAPRAQWERFDALMEKAYRPVAEHRAKQAAEHEQQRAAREAMLGEWRAWIAALDWEKADWRAVEKKRAEILGAWQGGAKLAPRDDRALRKRFDPLVAQLDARLAEARSAETERRRSLIARATGLREEADLAKAMNEAKSLQAKWREEASTVYLGRRRDEELWKKFRAACDAVFARRDAQRAERAAQAESALEGRRGLLKALQEALALPSAGEVEAAAARFQSAWRAAPALPRDAADGLEREARALARRAAERANELRNAQRSARYTGLARKAQLAREVEAVAAAGGDRAQALARAKEAWAVLPALAADAERSLARRLEAASAATRDSLAQGLARCAELLIDLELALDLPSPASDAAARRARQLERLKQRFAASGGRDEAPEQWVLRWYAQAAAADVEQDARMAAVVGALAAKEAGAPRR
jgi:exonuclease SbcC